MRIIYIIEGGKALKGEVEIKGAKNSLLAIIPATLLVEGDIILKNIGKISDVEKAISIMKKIGIKCNEKIRIINDGNFKHTINVCEAATYRASYYFMGALLSTKGRVEICYPGGCKIGERPIDIHLDGFRKMGCIVKEKDTITIEGDLLGTTIDVKKSVGATINMILAASRALGETILLNPALEPEVIDVADFLCLAGYDIKIEENIYINGRRIPRRCISYSIIPDRIEALTYIVIGLLLGEVKVKNVCLRHIEEVVYLLIKHGAKIRLGSDYVIAKKSNLSPMDISTDYYPGFPTDIQQIFTTMLSVTSGKSKISEKIFENRFQNVLELEKMGANIEIKEKEIIINGVNKLLGTDLVGSDLRGTMGLIIAGLIAEGKSTINNEYHIERGYDRFYNKIKKLGANIKKKN